MIRIEGMGDLIADAVEREIIPVKQGGEGDLNVRHGALLALDESDVHLR